MAIHVRRDDIIGADKYAYGNMVATKAYFIHAMDHIRKQLKSPAFVVGTNDYAWTYSVLGNSSDTVILKGNLILCYIKR